MGYPHSWMVYFMENPIKVIKVDENWGYPYFRKPPYLHHPPKNLHICLMTGHHLHVARATTSHPNWCVFLHRLITMPNAQMISNLQSFRHSWWSNPMIDAEITQKASQRSRWNNHDLPMMVNPMVFAMVPLQKTPLPRLHGAPLAPRSSVNQQCVDLPYENSVFVMS